MIRSRPDHVSDTTEAVVLACTSISALDLVVIDDVTADRSSRLNSDVCSSVLCSRSAS